MYMSAEMMQQGTMRISLERIWNHEAPEKMRRICVFVLMNPSKADAMVNDPTASRCIAFARYWGYDGMRIVNLVSYRATNPKDMHVWFKQQNLLTLNEHLTWAVNGCNLKDVAKVVLAYGKIPAFMRDHAYNVVMAISKTKNTYDIRLNNDGTPAHPLYLPGHLTPNLHFAQRT
jgi:hypothetical protein